METLKQKLVVTHSDFSVSVGFYRIENRFGHEVQINHKGHQLHLSTDDQIENTWPPCPPIQDIHFEDRGDSQLFFGVGMSGKTHYSLSIESKCIEPKSTNRIRFEFAAHVKDAPEFLGTSYLIKDLSDFNWNQQILPIRAMENSSLTYRDVQDQKTLTITPDGALPTAWPDTLQWGFDIED